MVGDGELEAEQPKDGAEQPLGLAQARRNTARSVSAVRIARGEYQGCPPGVVRGSARQAAMAALLNQTVRLPRWRKAVSYSAQFVIRRRCFGIR